jgi:hypothetical protein
MSNAVMVVPIMELVANAITFSEFFERSIGVNEKNINGVLAAFDGLFTK